MRLRKGCAAEYKKRHDEIWPELVEAFRKAGILEYTIFLDEKNSTLIGLQALARDNTLESLLKSEIMERWWLYMGDLMETAPGEGASRALVEMFSVDFPRGDAGPSKGGDTQTA